MNKIIPSTPKLDFRDVLIVPRVSFIESRKLVNLSTSYKFKHSGNIWSGIPIISSNMDSVTDLNTYKIISQRGYMSCFPKYFNKIWKDNGIPEELFNTDNYMLSCGINKDDVNTIIDLMKKLSSQGTPLKYLCIDVANGYLHKLVSVCAYFRTKFPKLTIIAGNVVTPELVDKLIINGVDVVKIGIGSGQVCLTRQQTGVGYPQLSAIMECVDAAKSLNAHIISDGGVTVPGDICKAYSAGADFVMLGSMLAAHDESPGDVINGHKIVYGMSSSVANNKHNGGLSDYRSSEGRVTNLPIKGPLMKTIIDIEGGIRSCCTYLNANEISLMYKNSKFILVNQQLEKTQEKYMISN
jgi:GMP reductase